MVILTAAPTGGIIKLSRDGKTDHVFGFEDGIDKINLSQFNINWSEVHVKYNGGGEFIITIRGERTKITFNPPTDGSEITQDFLGIDDFFYATSAPDPVDNILTDFKDGKVVIKLGTEGLVIRDLSGTLTSADFTDDMFVFV